MKNYPPRTHEKIDSRLCGTVLDLAPGEARVELVTRDDMLADGHGLVHGGFVFGLADYAAMLAVNHPHVVLGEAQVRFLKPVVVGDRLLAEARAEPPEGRQVQVFVEVRRGDETVFNGEFLCFAPERHVLQGS